MEANQQGAAIEVMNLKSYELTDEEQRMLFLKCQQLQQVTKVYVRKDILFIDVNMGSLQGAVLAYAIQVLLSRVIRQVNTLRPTGHLQLVKSQS